MAITRKEITKQVFCTLRVEGYHQWSNCPIEEVNFLRDRHRHVFHIKAYAIVSHGDRDIEFIMLKRNILQYMTEKYQLEDFPASRAILDFGDMSCEMIAEELIQQFDLSACEVSEDGENGSLLTVKNL